ncbi:hypothetical protein [Segnochrobactrum spirostomi]|uniref:Uncharacterized protein n=1 Tax=Segnochrobactrum spirostomi TaxID=2608987 RepID=A0A6A7YB31_9HYPH|nr:hypothetical protein [Segnochrobactrum spirostomi]MQT15151.1 hypothetical protein [Segnochrobactrum spirostomi]
MQALQRLHPLKQFTPASQEFKPDILWDAAPGPHQSSAAPRVPATQLFPRHNSLRAGNRIARGSDLRHVTKPRAEELSMQITINIPTTTIANMMVSAIENGDPVTNSWCSESGP